jgi:hypothetical protein
MVITGFMMWNPIATTGFLPGEAIPAAKAAHGNEALLAVLAVIIWHVYHVHLRRFNKSMFTGYLTEEEMLEEHPLELADLKAGVAARPLDPQVVARRQRAFFAAYGVIATASISLSPLSRQPLPPCRPLRRWSCSRRSPPRRCPRQCPPARPRLRWRSPGKVASPACSSRSALPAISILSWAAWT